MVVEGLALLTGRAPDLLNRSKVYQEVPAHPKSHHPVPA